MEKPEPTRDQLAQDYAQALAIIDRLGTNAVAHLLAALKDAVQTARNYYMLFHDQQWGDRLTTWEAAIAKAEGR